ncbi:uncharacterized protein [Triticum aestivum]|uniref:uncharacterized protein n=1 Tax=Triticum aestivum TaxID=4565 RepID=UPI00084598FB|nr:uncharacterized protein LOC123134843 [Triticum aestivum]
MGMAAALWDALSKAANLAQMSGLHAVMLVAVVASLLRVPQSKRECAKLERCSRRLCVLLQWPTGCGAVLLQSEMGGPAVKALVDAAGLVDDYKKSTLWRRVRWGRSMATRFRDMQDAVDSYYGILIFINANVLLQRATRHLPGTIHGVDDPPQSQSLQAVSNCSKVTATCHTQMTNNDTGEEGASKIGSERDNTNPTGCERSLPAIVISHA